LVALFRAVKKKSTVALLLFCWHKR
jgi:hypothetical protein